MGRQASPCILIVSSRLVFSYSLCHSYLDSCNHLLLPSGWKTLVFHYGLERGSACGTRAQGLRASCVSITSSFFISKIEPISPETDYGLESDFLSFIFPATTGVGGVYSTIVTLRTSRRKYIKMCFKLLSMSNLNPVPTLNG